MLLHNLKNNYPFIYYLSFRKKDQTLIVIINPECIEKINSLNPDNMIIKSYKESDFETNLEKNFGLNKCSNNKGIIANALRIEFPIIPRFQYSSEKCNECKGTKKSKYGDNVCWHCRLTGQERKYNHSLSDISNSLYVLLNYLNYVGLYSEERLSKTSLGNQLLVLKTVISNEMSGHAIGGEVSPLFLESIFSQDVKEISQQVSEGMHQVYLVIENHFGSPRWKKFERDYSFPCWIRTNEKSIHLQVLGVNDCCIHINNRGEIGDHNIDHAQQQLELLSGFAILSDYVYKNTKLLKAN